MGRKARDYIAYPLLLQRNQGLILLIKDIPKFQTYIDRSRLTGAIYVTCIAVNTTIKILLCLVK
jgi:hypothetical protein